MVVAAGSSSAAAATSAAPSATAAAIVVAADAADVAVAAAVAAVAVGGVSSRFGAVVAVGKVVVEADGGAGNEGCVVVAAAVSVAEEFSSRNASSSPELLSRAHSMGVENSASTSAGRFSSTEAADDDISSVSASAEGDIIAASSSLPTIGREHSSSSPREISSTSISSSQALLGDSPAITPETSRPWLCENGRKRRAKHERAARARQH